MNDNQNTQSLTQSRVGIFMSHVYQWMTIALLITAASAYYVMNSPALMNMLFGNILIMIVVFLAPFALVIYLNSAMAKLSSSTATALFMLYSLLMGVLLSSIVVRYTGSSIAQAFVCTAGTFGALSLYGTVTKRDLSAMASFLFMGLVGLIIVSIVNIFLGSSMLEFVISFAGILIFAGLTAYDTQRIREMGENAPLDDTQAIRRGAILGAISLYLDFINLFIFFLRLFGSSRD